MARGSYKIAAPRSFNISICVPGSFSINAHPAYLIVLPPAPRISMLTFTCGMGPSNRMFFFDPARGFIFCRHVNIEIRGAGGKALRETMLKFCTGW